MRASSRSRIFASAAATSALREIEAPRVAKLLRAMLEEVPRNTA
ncbi:MAG: hypothetical protein U0326_17250 [Polyangiales bacterium]